MAPGENARRQDDYEYSILTPERGHYPFHGLEHAINGAASLPKIVPPTAEYGLGTYSFATGRIWYMDNWVFLNARGPLSSHILGGC